MFCGITFRMTGKEEYILADTIAREVSSRRAPEVGATEPRGRSRAALAGFIGASPGAGVLGAIATYLTAGDWWLNRSGNGSSPKMKARRAAGPMGGGLRRRDRKASLAC